MLQHPHISGPKVINSLAPTSDIIPKEAIKVQNLKKTLIHNKIDNPYN